MGEERTVVQQKKNHLCRFGNKCQKQTNKRIIVFPKRNAVVHMRHDREQRKALYKNYE